MSSSIAWEQKIDDWVAPNTIEVPVKPDARNEVSSATVSFDWLVSNTSVQLPGGVVVVSALPTAARVGLPVSAF